MEASRTSKVLWMLLYAVITGFTLALFTLIDGMIKYLFSLAGLFLVIKYFKRGDTMSYRIMYIVFSIVFFFLVVTLFVMYSYMKQNNML